MKIPLREIERSITVNCAVDKKANKTLTLYKYQTGVNKGIARCVFIYIAIKCSYNPEEICDYLAITNAEYGHKSAVLADMHDRGRELFTTKGGNFTYADTSCTELIFYRKLLLAQNYLRYRFGYGS
jgi:hypothetical protein